MTSDPEKAAQETVLAIDAMGGDNGPETVVNGLAKAFRAETDLRAILSGPEDRLAPLVAGKADLAGRVEIRHAPAVVAMDTKPRDAARAPDDTSMWATLSTVAEGRAAAAVSCGNTGALMLMAMMRLKKAPLVDRPAIAVFWPAGNPRGWNIALDVGADVRAEPWNIAQYAVMGAEYARIGLDLDTPRVGLLNVGSEDGKGRAETREARALLERAAEPGRFAWIGNVEGGDLSGDAADVIVTDGFTGNVALKTAEGTAKLISDAVKDAFAGGLGGRLAGLLALRSLSRLRKRIDPRRVNGGVFLGLDGAVVKSHGGADATGVAAALELAASMGVSGFPERVAEQVANALSPGEGPGVDSKLSGTSDG